VKYVKKYKNLCCASNNSPGGMGGATGGCPGGFCDFYNFHELLQKKIGRLGKNLVKKRKVKKFGQNVHVVCIKVWFLI